MSAPAYLHAWDDCDWSYYVIGHDPDELHVIDDPVELDWENVHLRPVSFRSVREDPDEEYGGATRGPDGRFLPQICWIECKAEHPDAVAYMGCRYKPLAAAPAVEEQR